MTEKRQKLLDRFDKWLNTNPHKQIISAECANIAEDYANEQLRLYSVMYSKNGMNTPNPEKTHYTVWKFKETDNEFQIDGRNLVYCQLGKHHHGCQCMHTGDKPEHKEITNKLKQICDLFTDIEKLNKL